MYHPNLARNSVPAFIYASGALSGISLFYPRSLFELLSISMTVRSPRRLDNRRDNVLQVPTEGKWRNIASNKTSTIGIWDEEHTLT